CASSRRDWGQDTQYF
nr:T-cell receptor V beta CDR3 region {clone V5LK35} [mice, NOD, lymph node, Peptide Partial, 15 aa] [Mus sp.]